MTSRTIILLGIAAILLVTGGLFYASMQGAVPLGLSEDDRAAGEDMNASGQIAVPPEQVRAPVKVAPAPSQATGRVVVFLTDMGVSLDSIESIRMTVDEIAVAKGKGGWVAMVSSPREMDLMTLYRTSSLAVMADINLEEGTYDRVRMKIGKVAVVEKGSGGLVHDAKLPSGTMTFIGNLAVQRGKSSSMVIDVLAARALHKTGSGLFVFFPVMKVAMQSSVAVRGAGSGVYTTGGKSDFDATLGMDETGAMRSGFEFASGTEFEFFGSVIRVIPHGEKAMTGAVSAEAAVDAAVKSGYMDTAVSVQASVRAGKGIWRVFGLKKYLPVTVYIDAETGAVTGKE